MWKPFNIISVDTKTFLDSDTIQMALEQSSRDRRGQIPNSGPRLSQFLFSWWPYPLSSSLGCEVGWDHCTKDVLGKKGESWRSHQRWKSYEWQKWRAGELRDSSNSRARSSLALSGCPTPDKGRDISSGSQSFYYLIIPSVVPEIPHWSHYSPQGAAGMWGVCEGGGPVREGYLQCREGMGTCMGILGQPFPQEFWELCAFFLAGAKLPGMGLSSLGKDV